RVVDAANEGFQNDWNTLMITDMGGLGFTANMQGNVREPDWTQRDYSPMPPAPPYPPTVTLAPLTGAAWMAGMNPTTDHVRGDFEEKFLALTRISNLITT